MMNYLQAMTFVESFSHSGRPVTDLSRIAGLLDKLDRPQDKLRFVHIAGTNGKGSVAEYLTNILTESGYQTGTFTSPYIRHYEDRIRLNRREIPTSALCQLCEQVAVHVTGQEGYSQFEITFAIALLYYVQEQADIVVLETGLGGLLDCTNIIPPPLCSVITSISLDHMAILGDSVEKIAIQKAGIIKSGSPVVISPNNAAEHILKRCAEEKGCPVIIPDLFDKLSCIRNVQGLERSRFSYEGIAYEIRMCGVHQVFNAVTAIEVINALMQKNFRFSVEQVQRGMAQTAVPGRIQVLQENPLVLLDGCHNEGGIRALSYVLEESGVPEWIGICGMTHGDAVDFAARKMASYLKKVFCVESFADSAVPAETLCETFRANHTEALRVPLQNALTEALAQQKAVVIFGSLYLASWYLNQET